MATTVEKETRPEDRIVVRDKSRSIDKANSAALEGKEIGYIGYLLDESIFDIEGATAANWSFDANGVINIGRGIEITGNLCLFCRPSSSGNLAVNAGPFTLSTGIGSLTISGGSAATESSSGGNLFLSAGADDLIQSATESNYQILSYCNLISEAARMPADFYAIGASEIEQIDDQDSNGPDFLDSDVYFPPKATRIISGKVVSRGKARPTSIITDEVID